MTSNEKYLKTRLEMEELEAQREYFEQSLPPGHRIIQPGENISIPFMCFRSNIIPREEDIPTRCVILLHILKCNKFYQHYKGRNILIAKIINKLHLIDRGLHLALKRNGRSTFRYLILVIWTLNP